MSRDRLEKYLRNQMTESERHSLEQEMDSNPKLRTEFESLKEEFTSIEAYYLKEKLSAHADAIRPKPKWRSLVVILIILLIAFAIGTFLKNALSLNSSDKGGSPVASMFIQEPGLPVIMGSSGGSTFNDGMVDYRRESYQEAIRVWENALSVNSSDTMRYYLANAHQSLDQLLQADTYYKQIIANPNSAYVNKAYFNLAVIAFTRGEYENAKEFLAKTSLPNKVDLERELSRFE